ncbi:diguanylate cyclase [Jatrophihabitans telluris]|uniref:Diguanylate cyclase n=1 Tax=Jatrophihabitans telluris TaxID=2038343 RepID=A0ABY4R2L0_9ACTN|nr:sensor domain-containing diguanylate cyclase [Jatrophihabitans telluris]UQX89401.1 diguanylate cyclase [Jatrophihabitans telluris]
MTSGYRSDSAEPVAAWELAGVAFRHAPAGVAVADELGHYVAVNERVCRLLGRTEDQLLGRSSREFTHPDDLGQHGRAGQAIRFAGDGVLRVDKRFVRPDGSVRWARLQISHVEGPAGAEWTLAHMYDITEERLAAQATGDVSASLDGLARVMRSIQDGGDARTTIVTVLSELAGADFGSLAEPVQRAEAAAPTETRVAETGAAETRVAETRVAETRAAETRAAETGGAELVISASTDPSYLGFRMPVDTSSATAIAYLTGQPLFISDVANHPLVSPVAAAATGAHAMLFVPIAAREDVTGVLIAGWTDPAADVPSTPPTAVGLLADQAGIALAHAALVAELERLAATDPLTALPNRRGWDIRTAGLEAARRRSGSPVTVAIADLDRFKAFNDRYGHDAGDALLVAFTRAAAGALREVDVLARWGGEEFVIALPDCDAEQARYVLERVRRCVPDHQTCSIGYASTGDGETIEAALRRADTALYQAKRAGRDRTQVA